MEDTIAAIATPLGEGGVGMIRISGCEAKEILKKVVTPAGGDEPEDHRMTYGTVKDPDGTIIDEVLSVYMKEPRSYTAEDVAEIYCHGGMIPLRRTLERVLSSGARLAEPGEFTKRAFLNGRLDLSQAEAVMDVITARADETHRAAVSQLQGALSREIRQIRGKLVDLLVDLTVNIDYPDEDIEEMTYDMLEQRLTEVRDLLLRLLSSASTGRILREGLKVGIVGKPNVGKSSLMNGLLRESRAIVTEIPGTTRDTIEETLNVRGIPVVLTDTAGIRDTDDLVESIGIQRSRESAERSDLLLLVLDGSRPLDAEDRKVMELSDPDNTLFLRNKVDLPQAFTDAEIRDIFPDAVVIPTSFTDGTGFPEIEDAIAARVFTGGSEIRETATVTNLRHKALLDQAYREILEALQMAARREPLEIIEISANSAYLALGEIIGEAVTGDLLDEVFARFCLGK